VCGTTDDPHQPLISPFCVGFRQEALPDRSTYANYYCRLLYCTSYASHASALHPGR
jgi:hypothetical protein